MLGELGEVLGELLVTWHWYSLGCFASVPVAPNRPVTPLVQEAKAKAGMECKYVSKVSDVGVEQTRKHCAVEETRLRDEVVVSHPD